MSNKNEMKKIFNGIFRYETMDGAGRCPIYLERWTLFHRFGIGLYLHHFLGDDWAIDPHDHPRRFISIGLKGWYYEDVFHADGVRFTTTKFSAPWCRTFPAEHLHRIRAADCGNTWTLVIVLKKCRAWGYVRDGIWMQFKDYVFGGSARKSCK
jgi:hypothetical protein